jgi:predicted ATPase/DNA-binding CsgD family transcriptional regulator
LGYDQLRAALGGTALLLQPVLPVWRIFMSSTQNKFSASAHLPSSPSAFIGRGREIGVVKRLLQSYRLVTLTGPGGCGKTRLALQAAQDQTGSFPDGVWLVELAPLANPELVPHVVASSLGVREDAAAGAAAPSAALINHLRSRRALLLLDNCEHLVDACAQLCAVLLEACPELVVLATSREILRIPGEAVWSVPPLSLPEPQPWRSPDRYQEALIAYQQSEAVQLFAARAAAAVPGFALDSQTAPWVAEICRRLDGLPLAIELAAARTRAFSVQQIAERLDSRFHLLSQGARTAAPRHQTLDAALDWSFNLLADEEQRTLRRLGVFAGDWHLEAAEAVCQSGEVRGDVLITLANLVDKSLVVPDQAFGETRYHLLATIRSYALQKLEAADETAAARDRHFEHYLRWAETVTENLAGPDQAHWLLRFAAEYDNLRAALEWSLGNISRAAEGLRLAAACGRFWRLQGLFAEGRTHLQAVLERLGPHSPDAVRARAVIWAAHLAYLQSDFSATTRYCEEALRLSRPLGPEGRDVSARALTLLGEIGTEVGDYSAASTYFDEAMVIFQEMGDRQGIGNLLLQSGWAAMRTGSYEQAEKPFTEALLQLRELGVLDTVCLSLAGLGELSIRQGKLERAALLLEESLALWRNIGQPWGIAAVLGSLGWIALLKRDFQKMRLLLGESIALRLDIGERGGLAWSLEKLAEGIIRQAQPLPLARRRLELQRAVRVFGAAHSLRQSVNAMIDPVDQPSFEKLVEELQAVVGDEVFSAEWAAGSVLPLPEIIAQALAAPGEGEAVPPISGEQAAKAQFGGLSRREREVAVLIAQGKTNTEIAEQMVVGLRTVETYVTRILNKLGFNSRVQIATWAYETGLFHPKSKES